jgi:hypothetical protein
VLGRKLVIGDQDQVNAGHGARGVRQVKPPGPVQDLGFDPREDVDAGQLAQWLHGPREERDPASVPAHVIDQAEPPQPALTGDVNVLGQRADAVGEERVHVIVLQQRRRGSQGGHAATRLTSLSSMKHSSR